MLAKTMHTTDYLLIDGTNLAFRCFYGVKQLSSDDVPINAIYGFVNALWALEKLVKFKDWWVFFDCSRSARRTQIFPLYKANRAETPALFKPQLPYIKQIVSCLGGHCVEKMGVEADDLLGALAKKIVSCQSNAIIVSADKDLMQCVNVNVSQLIPAQQSWQLLDVKGVHAKLGLWPNQVVEYLALMGDTVDNFEGLHGVGPKTAARWLQTYQSIEGIWAHREVIQPVRFRTILEQNQALISRNLQLAQLDCSEELVAEYDLSSRVMTDFDALADIFQSLHLNSLIKRMQGRQTSVEAQGEFSFD